MFLCRFTAAGRSDLVETCFGTPNVGRQVAASMSTADLETRITVQRAFPDKVRKRNRRFQRVSDDIAQKAVALQSRLHLSCDSVGLRMDKYDNSEFLRLRPERVEPRRAEVCPVYAPSD